MNRQRFLKPWQRFIALFLVGLIVVTGFRPALAQMPGTHSPTLPLPPPSMPVDEIAPPGSNLRFIPVKVVAPVEEAAGIAVRGIVPWIVKDKRARAVFALSVAGVIVYYTVLGKTNLTWDDLYPLLLEKMFTPFATPAEQAVKQPAPETDYPCGDSTANYPGKIASDTPKTTQEKGVFAILNQVTGGVIQDNFAIRFGSEVKDAKRLAAVYSVAADLWAEHRIPAPFKDSKGRKVYLRWFRNQRTVIDYEYKFVTDCEEEKQKKECDKVNTDLSTPIDGDYTFNSGNLPAKEIGNFEGQKYFEVKTKECVRLYRVWGKPALEIGGYWTRVPIPQPLTAKVVEDLRDMYAVRPEWNTMTNVVVRDFKVGTVIFIGNAASQPPYNGGSQQVFMDDVTNGRNHFLTPH